MADKKISQLTALSAANLAPSTDVLAIVDTSATETKKIVAQDLINGVLNVASAVGIGTASPTYKLDVNNGGGSAAGLRVSGNDQANVRLRLENSGSGGRTWELVGGLPGANNTNFSIRDVTGSTTPLTLDTSGNLGLGVTPSAWNSSYRAFQVGGSGVGIWSTSSTGGNLYFSNNVLFDSTGTRKYIANAAAAEYESGSVGHVWKIAPSGTAGNTISFTQAMTLDASGNLGVGTTSPAFKLQVIGSTQLAINAAGTQQILQLNNSDTTAGVQTSKLGFSSAGVNKCSIIGAVYGDGYMAFATNNDTERGRFTAGGYFKASNTGTYNSSTSSQHEFYQTDNANALRVTSTSSAVSGAYGLYVDLTADPNATDSFFIRCYGGANQRASIRSNGGLANYQTNDVNLSDERVKADIAPLGSMWAKFKAIEIVTFKYKDQTHDDDNIGVIAQQVESVAPEFVDIDGWGETPEDGVPLKSIYTADMYHAAIKALQEAMARIESLEADMAALKGAK